MPISLLLPIAAFLLGGLAGAAGGYRYADAQGTAALAELERQIALRNFQAEAALRNELEAAHERGNRLAGDLARTKSRVTVRTVEVIRHVPDVTSGQRCLGPDAVRLLNGALVAAGDGAGLPETAGGIVDPPRSAAASDRDVAGWIATAAGRYRACTAQLNALIDWHSQSPDE
ncbi:hypothetical protein [Methylococcus mesophilus]|uniref:hypothetical protein n=1 Tax=Methylococcus mesophilus TaxID=2993564 RepID=UPI00224B3C44|nr:hypothetical protein [Methylococcus mesophilus]UZR27444.1 hypothetical protein OOT43_11935 [Methylococcus mesophilus]